MSERSKYPGLKTQEEADRLLHQQLLFENAIGLLLAPLDTSLPDLRILDSGTADGYWLKRVGAMTQPSTALFGTDAFRWKTWDNEDRSSINFSVQDVRDAWPASFLGSFDLVHQKAVLAHIKDPEELKAVVRGLVDLLKPGGWIQLDEGCLPVGPLSSSDGPVESLFKRVGNFMYSKGMDPQPAKKLLGIFDDIPNLDRLGCKNGFSLLGCTAPSVVLQEAGLKNVLSILHTFGAAVSQGGENANGTDVNFEVVQDEQKIVKQLKETGSSMYWSSVWAQKSFH